MSTLKSKYLKFNVATILLLIVFFYPGIQTSLFSQISLNSYAEVGSNAVSQGIYGNYSAQISGRKGSLSLTTGALLSVSNATDQVFSAYSLQVANDFSVGKTPLNLTALFLRKRISADFRETNFALIAGYRTTHFGYKIGLNTRIYSFTQAAVTHYNFADSIHTSFWEPINLMYKFSYFLPFSEKLNFEASVTNYDHYFIQQETNPMILTNLTYDLNSNFQLYSELGYMQAGLLNMHVNFFGLYLRGGVIWRIN